MPAPARTQTFPEQGTCTKGMKLSHRKRPGEGYRFVFKVTKSLGSVSLSCCPEGFQALSEKKEWQVQTLLLSQPGTLLRCGQKCVSTEAMTLYSVVPSGPACLLKPSMSSHA